MPSVFDWLVTKKRSLRPKKKGVKLSPAARYITLIIIAAFIIFVLRYSSQIIHPFIWAVITAYLFAPLIYLLEKRTRVPRILWIIIVYALIGLIIYWCVSFALPILRNEVQEIFGKGNDQSLIAKLQTIGKGQILGVDVNYGESISKFQDWIVTQVQDFAVPVFFGFVERLMLLSAYLIVTFYLLLDGEKYIRLLLLLFPTKYRREVTDVANEINETLGAYIRGQVLLILIMSLASWIVLFTLGIKHAFVLCLTTGILEVVPIIGPVVATALAALVAFNQTTVAFGLTNITLTLIVIASYYVLRQIEDLIVIPNVVGHFIHVHPVIVLLALFIGARIGGMLGIFLALPVSAVLKILFNYLYPKLIE
jgi:predicted PurR-regulated permease PerM